MKLQSTKANEEILKMLLFVLILFYYCLEINAKIFIQSQVSIKDHNQVEVGR